MGKVRIMWKLAMIANHIARDLYVFVDLNKGESFYFLNFSSFLLDMACTVAY
jgi:hypothetical protein